MGALDIIVWVLFASAQLADVLTTRRLLAQGGHERNPVVAFFMGRMGGAWWLVKIGLAWGAAGVLQWFGYPLAVLALGVVTGAVAANNYRQIK